MKNHPFSPSSDRKDEKYDHLVVSNTVHDLVKHPAFAGFGKLLLPRDDVDYRDGIRITEIAQLMPYHSNVDPATVVDGLNHIIDDINDGKTVFYDFYGGMQLKQIAGKESTGLFYFRGKAGAPFAVLCPGGGFSYVGSLHEGFPHAAVMSKQGFNAFVLKYRVGGAKRATEDLAAAISYIIRNAGSLEVGVDGYSLWGSSAGARMVANIGSAGVASYGGDAIQKPSMIVMAYTGHSNFTKKDPPTFVVVGENDPIVSIPILEERISRMRSAGIDVAYYKYKNVGHGFGLGTGTTAEGWIQHAIQFWRDHMLI